MRLRLFLSLVALGAASAQGPNPPAGPGGPARMPQPDDFAALKIYLNLTDAQIEQMRNARERAMRDAEEKARTLSPQIRDKHMALEDLLAKGTNDANAVGRLVLDIRALEKQVRDAREAVRTSPLSVLTAEQKTKFRAIEEAASMPQATRDAVRLGLVPGAPNAPGPNQPGPRMQGPGPGVRGPNPPGGPMNRQQGPGPGVRQPVPPPPPRGPEGNPELRDR